MDLPQLQPAGGSSQEAAAVYAARGVGAAPKALRAHRSWDPEAADSGGLPCRRLGLVRLCPARTGV